MQQRIHIGRCADQTDRHIGILAQQRLVGIHQSSHDYKFDSHCLEHWNPRTYMIDATGIERGTAMQEKYR
ncbi:hypothetical protein SAMN05216189_1001128 [Pseudomonas delhiensis]|uniref:Uncharacterized protein n=1 Tax=Pseudomonas delhiensis TaxID=366289 RepID=A0A1G8GR32_9PSED|nr:hypothetical protein SAMN05216189_1001128 [Pseudomonas delhiensis]